MNLQFLAENTFVISLKERKDRRKNVTIEMRNQKIAFQFFDGIKDSNPIYGCTASHVGVIKIAKEKKLPYVLIFEDDAKFVQPFRLPALPDNWDMLYLGSCVNKIYDEYYYNWKKVCCWYGHSYIVRECMYDRIIEEASKNWDKVLIDEYYCEFLHPHINAYTIYPTMVTQSEDYSDILQTRLDRHQKIINFDRLIEMKNPNPALFRDIYCINTQERNDKFEYISGLLISQNLKAQFYRPNRNMKNGAKGCRESHLAVLRDAKKRGLPSVLILEDDVDFVGNIRDIVLPKKWDMFYIGGNWVDILDKSESDHYCKVRSWSTYAYAVNRHFYDVLIEGLEKTEKEIDRYYLENIHPNHRVYMSKPQIVVPSEKFEDSDIMGKKMDYGFLREAEKINLGEKNVSKPAKVKITEMKKVEDADLPMVSIITPTYNRKNFVKLMIYNFFSQNYPADKLEWIIVDDGTESISGMLPNDSRIKYYHFGEEENGVKLPIGMKRNIGANLAAEGSIIVHMDDDDYYPPNSVRIRVMAILSSGKECVSCSAIANFNIKRMISMINVPPYDMSYEKRVSEACLCYTKGFWERQKYNNRAICSEAEDFIGGRTGEVVDTDWQGIIISLRHSGNMSNRNEMTEEPNGWHFGKIEDKLFLFLTSFDE
jgi:GR25 family glycosyltransferase involved in LPS biosynthesis